MCCVTQAPQGSRVHNRWDAVIARWIFHEAFNTSSWKSGSHVSNPASRFLGIKLQYTEHWNDGKYENLYNCTIRDKYRYRLPNTYGTIPYQYRVFSSGPTRLHTFDVSAHVTVSQYWCLHVQLTVIRYYSKTVTYLRAGVGTIPLPVTVNRYHQLTTATTTAILKNRSTTSSIFPPVSYTTTAIQITILLLP